MISFCARIAVLATIILVSSQLLSAQVAKTSLPQSKELVVSSTAPMVAYSSSDKADEYAGATYRSAEGALAAGMPSLAQSIIEDFFLKAKANQSMQDKLRMLYVDSLIAQGNFELAHRQMASIVEISHDNAYKIRQALILIGLGDIVEAQKAIDAVDTATLSKNAIAWYHLAKGYVLFQQSRFSEALKEFDEAKNSTDVKFAIIDAEIAINICKISSDYEGVDIGKLEKELAEQTKFYMGTAAGFQFAKQYAAVLFKLGKQDEALDVIDQQLGIQLAQDIDKDELRIISAVMTKNKEKQTAMLLDILRETSSVGVAEYAIAILSKNPQARPKDFEEFLDNVVKNGSPKICDRILLEIAKINVKNKNSQQASKVASKMMEEFPASKYKPDALRILAWAAFYSDKDKVPEYRLAASYLMELAATEKLERAMEIRMLAADCYFLNKDYATAAKIYRELFDRLIVERSELLSRAVDSYLALEDLAGAETILDFSYKLDSIKDTDLWNAEWKLVNKLIQTSQKEKAIERIDRIISADTNCSPMLKLRMMWLKARISESNADYEQVTTLCNDILNRIKSIETPEKESLKLIASNTLLMKARTMEMQGKDAESAEVYRQLRADYKDSDAAQVSYLYQARDEALQGKYESAYRICQNLADTYPQGKHTYAALFDAAEYARRVGAENNYRAALTILDKLCKDFPNDGRNFYARLSQAEILRLLNAFADARVLYNEIINKYQSHPELYLALMGLGDSILAQINRESDAIAIFERLYSLPEMPQSAKAEAAFKWSFALERAGKTREANEVRWLTSSNLLSNEELNDESVRYWIGRSLYTLAKSLEASSQMRDARAAYELIVKYKLPSYPIAERKLKNITQK